MHSAEHDLPIRLLIVNDDAEESETTVSHLRNAGLAVRPARAASIDEMKHHLASHPFDVVLAASPCAEMTDGDILHEASATGRDLPVVVQVDHIDDAHLVALTEAGARGIVLRGQFFHLQMVVTREFDDLEARRGMRRLEAQVRETERRCDALIESSRDPIAYVHEGMHIRANAAYLEMFGYDEFEDVEGMSLLDLVAPPYVQSFKQLLRDISHGEAPPPMHELEVRDAAGNVFPALMEFTQAKYEGEPCIQIVIRKQEYDPAMAQELDDLRRRDIATGLYNRQTFLKRLEDLVGRVAADGSQHAMLLVEPDQAGGLEKQVGLGNLDGLAVAIAKRLTEVLGPEAEIARIGESSFALTVQNSDYVRTQLLAERIREAFDGNLLETPSNSLSATVSIGAVQIGERIAQVSRVLAKANEALHTATSLGGNRIEIFDPSATERAEEERVRAWVAHVRDAIAAGALKSHYQPIVNLHDESEYFYESLLRMVGSDGHLLLPAQFVPVAEEHGMGGEIDRWAIRRALMDVQAHPPAARPIKVLVKISRQSLADPGFVAEVDAIIREVGAKPASLILQISESKVFTNLRQAQRIEAELRGIGVGFCIEHFGVGLNSLQLLNHLRPDIIKLNGDFIETYQQSEESRARVQELVDRIHDQHIPCIARGVTNAATMTAMFTSGIEYVQGDFVASISESMSGAHA